jgi:low temperature requirement protein LtrA
VLAVAVSGALWWLYFCGSRPCFEHAMAARVGNARSSLARDVFSVIHFPMLCGVIAMAAATKHALAHPDMGLAPSDRIALGGGALLFVGGATVAMWRATGRVPLWRSVLIPVAAVAVAIGSDVPWVAMAVLLAALVTAALIEHRAADPSPRSVRL